MKLLAPGGDSFRGAAVYMQTAISALALLLVFRIGTAMRSELAGSLAALFYSVNFHALSWNKFVLTDSLFISFVIISVWALIKSGDDRRFIAIAIPVCVFTASLRPNGVVYFIAFAAYLVSLMPKKVAIAVISSIAVAVLAASPFLFDEIQKATDRIQLIDNLTGGYTIWETEKIEMPPFDKQRKNVIADAAGYIAEHPAASLKLMLARLYTGFVFTRADYSPAHNAIILAIAPPLYLLAIIGAWVCLKSWAMKPAALIIGVVAAQAFIFALTFSDHDPRFTCYVLTLVAILAAAGVDAILTAITGGRFSMRKAA